ncbi:hypothetical protein J4U01_gp052 [Mycobacterium phage Kumao]|uniref:Uncharacterized protein n=1 Tax=Mycobacterium phage Kumao TaxID=2041344 RepID=A0A2D1GPW7_9CAUD|nr:hypothetical protein J4U01_gp052 [Mycobacterium phage Kumao]ATN94015.1 hypothetical protein SEA_KUMAO_52 [Mycobacterium phage Kumao]
MAQSVSDLRIPLYYAEMLFVAFSSVVDQMDADDRAVKNLRTVLKAYEQTRTRWLRKKGVPVKLIRSCTQAAAEALVDWLDEKAAKEEASEKDFELWAQELQSDD